MTSSKNKTTENDNSVKAFLETIVDDKKRKDSYDILNIMQTATGHPPKMWGSAIIGFGTYHYVYASGREGDFMCAGFSPRKKNISLYIMGGHSRFDHHMKKLGKYKTGKSCVYINSLSDIDQKVLHDLIKESSEYIANKKWP